MIVWYVIAAAWMLGGAYICKRIDYTDKMVNTVWLGETLTWLRRKDERLVQALAEAHPYVRNGFIFEMHCCKTGNERFALMERRFKPVGEGFVLKED